MQSQLLPPRSELLTGTNASKVSGPFERRSYFENMWWLVKIPGHQDIQQRDFQGQSCSMCAAGLMTYISCHERPMVVLQEGWFSELLLLELSGEPVSMPGQGSGAGEWTELTFPLWASEGPFERQIICGLLPEDSCMIICVPNSTPSGHWGVGADKSVPSIDILLDSLALPGNLLCRPASQPRDTEILSWLEVSPGAAWPWELVPLQKNSSKNCHSLPTNKPPLRTQGILGYPRFK